jgi:hypothetical protein
MTTFIYGEYYCEALYQDYRPSLSMVHVYLSR